MQCIVKLKGQASQAAGNAKECDITLDKDAACVGDIAHAVAERYGEAMRKALLDENNQRVKMNVLVNGSSAVYRDPVPDGATVTLFTLMGGG